MRGGDEAEVVGEEGAPGGLWVDGLESKVDVFLLRRVQRWLLVGEGEERENEEVEKGGGGGERKRHNWWLRRRERV